MTWKVDNRTGTRAWRTLKASILLRDGGQCTRVVDGQRCQAPATTVDHILNVAAGGTDEPSNLASLCKPHHDEKTKAETAAARWRHRAQRPERKHPGLNW